MTLRTKTIFFVGAVLVVVIAALCMASRTIMLAGFGDLEDRDTRLSVQRVVNAMEDELSALNDKAADWAVWDDAYAYMADENPGFIQSNVVPRTFSDLKLNFMLFIDPSGEVVMGRGFDLEAGREVPYPESLARQIKEDCLLLNHSDSDSSKKGIVLLSDGPALVASRPIVTSEGKGPIRGTIIMGRFLTDGGIKRLGETTRLSASGYRFDDDQMPPDWQAARAALSGGDATLVRPLNDETVAGYTVVKDVYGQPALLLRVESPRDVYRQGLASLRYLIEVVLGIGLVSGLAIVLLLDRLVLTRMAHVDSERRYRRLTENAPDMIFRLEEWPSRRFSYVSPAAADLLGYSPEELCEDPDLVFQILAPEDRTRVMELLSSDVAGGPTVVRFRHRDGRIVWIETHVTPIRDDSGRLVAHEGIGRDISERRQLETKLLRAHRLETAGTLAGQVAHDFNNLLGPLMAYPDLIKMQLEPDHPALAYCSAMSEAAERMAAINEDMLALGRRGQISVQPVDLNRIVEEMSSQVLGNSPAVKSEFRLDPCLRPVSGSPAQLSRVVLNLVSNALEAMRGAAAGACLTVQTENLHLDLPVGSVSSFEPGEFVMLSVTDTGCGIPSENLDKIFEPFFTTKSSSRRRGCGLGLSVVKSIVEDHHGCLDIASEVGKGTTFRVFLPTSRV
jgi:PAS domain S-box-containing protein